MVDLSTEREYEYGHEESLAEDEDNENRTPTTDNRVLLLHPAEPADEILAGEAVAPNQRQGVAFGHGCAAV